VPLADESAKHCEPCLLLRCGRSLLQASDGLRGGTVGLEHARVRRDGEEILREAVMDLARDAGAFLGDRASELREANRAPDADEQDAEGEDAEEVPLRDGPAVDEGREDQVQRREEHQGRAEREPAIEVVAVIAEPPREAGDRAEIEERLRSEQPREHERDARVLTRRRRRDVR